MPLTQGALLSDNNESGCVPHTGTFLPGKTKILYKADKKIGLVKV